VTCGWTICLLRTIAAAKHVRVADAFTAITLSGRTCELTFACLPGDLADFHPNDDGYAVMAQLFYRAAGYSRLGRVSKVIATR
jgi:lysophospholipase L1-like esterase